MPLRAILTGCFKKKCDKTDNGKKAVAMYRASMEKQCCDVRYKLILTDVQMPVMDGITAAKVILALQEELLRANPSLPKITITAISAYNDASTKRRCRNAGITGFLSKPISLDQLKPTMDATFPAETAQ